MTESLSLDARGRVTIPRKMRKVLGKKFVAILHPGGVELYPVKKHLDIPVEARDVTGEDQARRELGL